MLWTTVLNFVVWYIFVFIGVLWIIVMFQNKRQIHTTPKMNAKLPFVSVLIPAFNEEGTISKTIRSVLSLDYPKRLIETIVVNDCSTDRTRRMAESFGSRITLLNNRKNRGKSYSLNRAMKVARGEFVACIDADSLVKGDALKKMVCHFNDPKVAAVTPALKVYKTRTFLEKIQHAEYLLNVFLRKMLAFIDAIHVTPGVFSVYRKDLLMKLGGFEEGNLTEDMEIALKLHKAGYRIENDLNAVSYTYCPAKWGELFKQRIRWYRGAIQNSIKYKYMFFNPRYGNIGLFFLPLNFIAVLAIIVIFFITAWNYLVAALGYVWKMSIINWDILGYLSMLDLSSLPNLLLSTPLMFGMIGLAMGGYILYISFRVNRYSLKKNKPGYIIYLVLFPFVMMAFWSLALIYEVLRLQRKW
jgi:cellulose synthase/poly-beta-1,6-N-acetylglucosamine synthase-like glycosyltransferase